MARNKVTDLRKAYPELAPDRDYPPLRFKSLKGKVSAAEWEARVDSACAYRLVRRAPGAARRARPRARGACARPEQRGSPRRSVTALSRLALLRGRPVAEAEVNPLVVKAKGAVAVDALVVLREGI